MARDLQKFMAKLDQGELWSRIVIGSKSGCWEAVGLPEHGGYPYFKGYKLSHVLFWFKHRHGPQPKMAIVHSCGNSWCCNPEHIKEGKLGDLQKNVDRSTKTREANRAKRLSEYGSESSVIARIKAGK